MNRTQIMLLRKLNPKDALSDVRSIVALGRRAPGTEGERRAFSWIRDKLEEMDYRVEEDTFRIVGWQDRRSELTVNQERIRLLTFGYSPSVEIDTKLVCLRTGREEEYRGIDVKGKLVLVEWGQANMRRVYWNALANGAAGVILGFTVPNLLRFEALGVDGYPLRIPVAMIELRHYRRISSKANTRLEARLSIRAITDLVSNSMNLSAVKKGRNHEEVLALAHVDCWYKGANDNASTIAIVLQMARAFSQLETERGIRFLFTGSEEAGDLSWLYYLKGAAAYVDAHPERIRSTMAVVNGDVTGNGERLYVETTPELARFASSVARQLGISKFKLKIPPSTWQETFAFTMYGLPAVCLMWASYNQYHTHQDLPNIIDKDKFSISMKTIAIMLHGLSTNHVFPCNFSDYAELMLRGNENHSMSGIMTPHRAMRANPGLDGWMSKIPERRQLTELAALLEKLAHSFRPHLRKVEKNPELAGKLNVVSRVLSGRLNPLFVGAVVSDFGLEESTLPTLRILDDVVELSEAAAHLKTVRAASWNPALKSFISYFGRSPTSVDVSNDLNSIETKLKFAENIAEAECRLLSRTVEECLDLMRMKMG